MNGADAKRGKTDSFTFTSNRSFPSSLVSLFQNETFHMKMSSACSFIFTQIKVILIMVSHLDSLWNRGTRELGIGPSDAKSLATLASLWFIIVSLKAQHCPLSIARCDPLAAIFAMLKILRLLIADKRELVLNNKRLAPMKTKLTTKAREA